MPASGSRFHFALLVSFAAVITLNDPVTSVSTPHLVKEGGADELVELTFNVLQLTVPKNIKMNDINDYREIVLPKYSNTNIQLTNMSRNGQDVGFAMIQLHAYEYNVTLSYTKTVIDGQHLSGSNVGLILYGDGNLYAINLNPHENVMVGLVLMLYNKTAPLPGGCNLEFPVEVSPVMKLTLLDSTIEVDTPPAGLAKQFQPKCGKFKLTYESYYISMPSYDFSQRTYFSNIIKLISYANAKASGRINNLVETDPGIKRVYGRQVGRGMVFVTVAIDPINAGFAAYVPIQTYACLPFLNLGACYEFNIPLRIMGVIVTIIFLVEIVAGFLPLCFKSFVCGLVVGMLMTVKILEHFIIPGLADHSLIGILAIGAITGAVLFTIMSLVCPVAAIVISNTVCGYLLCSVLFYGIYGRPYLGLTFFVCAAIAGLILCSFEIFLFANAFLFGAMGLFYGVNVVFSARLHYSVWHQVRGLFEVSSGSVLSDTTLDTNELMAISSFCILLSICIYLRVRCKLRDNQTVSPTGCTSCCRRGSTSSAAFLTDDSFAYDAVSNAPTITRWTSGDDDVFESPESNSRFFERLRSIREN